jgi:hypothetical protein
MGAEQQVERQRDHDRRDDDRPGRRAGGSVRERRDDEGAQQVANLRLGCGEDVTRG